MTKNLEQESHGESVVTSGGDLFSTSVDYLSEAENTTGNASSLPANLKFLFYQKEKLYGYDLRRNVADFFASSQISKQTKKRLYSFMSGLGQDRYLEMILASIAATGRSRLKRNWSTQFRRCDKSQAYTKLAAAASRSCMLFTDSNDATFLMREGGGKASIGANPLFAGLLSDNELAQCVAHEYLHHVDGHHQEFERTLKAVHLECRSRGQVVNKARLSSLVNRSLDCVVNKVIKSNGVRIDLPDQEGPKYDRLLLAVACSFGHGVREGNLGCFTLPLQTYESTSEKYRLSLHGNETAAEICRAVVTSPLFTGV